MPTTLNQEQQNESTRLSPPSLKGDAYEKLEKSAGKSKRKLLTTAAVWSLLAFVGLNALLGNPTKDEQKPTKAKSLESQEELWSGTASIDLAVNDFNALKQAPNVVLLGSSLIMHPFWAMDVARDKKIGDIFHHHTSVALKDALAQNGLPNERIFSFAIFGQMISDAYIYVDDFLKGDKKPDLLYFGIAPRDFADADVPTPTATQTFKRLVGLENFPRYADFYLPGIQEKADFIASHSIFFYGRRWRLQHEVAKAFEKVYDGLGFSVLAINSPGSAESAHPGFMLSGTSQERWMSSLKEYRHRYQNIDRKDLSVQMGFFERILKTCADRHIRVVVVNMPLTKENRDCMPDGFYDSFRQRVREVAEGNGAGFVDLGSATQFTKKDFWDTAHLDQFGGHKLIDATLPAIKAELQKPR